MRAHPVRPTSCAVTAGAHTAARRGRGEKKQLLTKRQILSLSFCGVQKEKGTTPVEETSGYDLEPNEGEIIDFRSEALIFYPFHSQFRLVKI